MASFVIHNIAGERLLKLLEDNYGVNLSVDKRYEFLLGNLIVDSSKLKFQKLDGMTEEKSKKVFRKRVQEEKKMTHFRNEDDTDLCIQVPNLSKFENKYGDLLSSSLAAIGYLFHLYTDKMFFEELFTSTFDTLDKRMMPTIYTSETKMMRVRKNNQIYTIEEFWDGDSKTSIYHDYTVMNKILLDYYGSSFDKDKLLDRVGTFVNPGIEEVEFSNVVSIINKTASFINDSYNVSDNTLNIFDEDIVKKFIDDNADNFINKYFNLFGLSKDNVKRYKKTIKR